MVVSTRAVAPRAILTIIAGASLISVTSPLRLQFALPGFQAGFSANFGLGGMGGISDSADAGIRGVSSRSSSGGSGRVDHQPRPPQRADTWSSLASGFFGAGALDFPGAPWGWRSAGARSEAPADPERPATTYSTAASASSGLNQPLIDGPEAGAFAAWSESEADIPFAGGGPNILGTGDGRDVQFTLFTRQGSGFERLSSRDPSSLTNSKYNPRRKTKIVTHGFGGNTYPGSGCVLVKDAFLRVADVNVILVDWSAVDTHVYPVNVQTTVPLVGGEIAALIKALVEHRRAELDDFHVIGHSLGAQIAGAAGSLVLGPAGKGWVTGLDPAGPLYEGKEPSERIDDTDAAFVDAVHTDGGFLGIVQPVGHVDYYVDGGMHARPECGADVSGLCTHCYAYDVLAHAITNAKSVVGVKCDPAKVQRGDCHSNEKMVVATRPKNKRTGSFYVDSARSGLKLSEDLRRIGQFRFNLNSIVRVVNYVTRPGSTAMITC